MYRLAQDSAKRNPIITRPDGLPRRNLLKIFQSEPLVTRGCNSSGDEILHELERLDFDYEKEQIVKALSKATYDIRVQFEIATINALRTFICQGENSILHFSGHGHPGNLMVEDGYGAMQPLHVEKLREFMKLGGQTLKLVFVSACHSRTAGETFLEAGVDYVVCCEMDDARVLDKAAVNFALAFYQALGCGRTLKVAMEFGRQQVKNTPELYEHERERENKKFKLLCREGCGDGGDIIIFHDTRGDSLTTIDLPDSQYQGHSLMNDGSISSAESSSIPTLAAKYPLCEKLIPRPPARFMGRQGEVYRLLTMLRRSRSVLVTGRDGIGKRAVVGAASLYMRAREDTFQHCDLWLPPNAINNDDLAIKFNDLFENLRDREGPDRVGTLPSCQHIAHLLKNGKYILVFDVKELGDCVGRLPHFINFLMKHTQDVKVVVIDHKNVIRNSSQPTIEAEELLHLRPLSFTHTAKLFGTHCKHVREPEDFATEFYPAPDTYREMGSGIPQVIQRKAKSISVEDCSRLLDQGKVFTSRAALDVLVAKVEDMLGDISSNNKLPTARYAAGGERDVTWADKAEWLHELSEELKVLQESQPTLSEIEEKLCDCEIDLSLARKNGDSAEAHHYSDLVKRLKDQKRLEDADASKSRDSLLAENSTVLGTMVGASGDIIPQREMVAEPSVHYSGESLRVLREQGFTLALAKKLAVNASEFQLRIWIVDNSGSMLKRDGHRMVRSAVDTRVIEVVDDTRWTEIQETVAYHAKMAARLKAPTVFRLLNDPGRNVGPQEFSVAETPTTIEDDLRTATDVMERTKPAGVTPLTAHLNTVRQRVEDMRHDLKESGKRVAIVIATDGHPSDAHGCTSDEIDVEFREALKSFEGLPVWIVIRLGTDEQDVVDYYNNFDFDLELSLEVLDDFLEEAKQVHRLNKWLNYGLALHRCREMGFSDRLLDLLDERKLTPEEIRQFLQLLLGDSVMAVNPREDPELFLRTVSQLLDDETKQWNPIVKKVEPWVNLSELKKNLKPDTSGQSSYPRLGKGRYFTSPIFSTKFSPKWHFKGGKWIAKIPTYKFKTSK